MALMLDMTQVKEPVALNGDFPGSQTKFEITPSKSGKPTPNIKITYTIDASAPPDAAGRTLDKYFPTAPEHLGMWKDTMVAMGHPVENLTGQQVDGEAITLMANGRPCILHIEPDAQSREKCGIKYVKPKGA